ncbi:MBL fold metallo-hydrolase [Nonomuraea jabiensis]|uniref:MBL fold metallo-hydrolase n=1 Tax=Nonomuraea jabiensis TaxID=882448 RepID=UPI003432BAA0
MHEDVRAWTRAPLTTAFYSHGHVDHAFGTGPFEESGPLATIYSHKAVVDRFERYVIEQHQLALGLECGHIAEPRPPADTLGDRLNALALQPRVHDAVVRFAAPHALGVLENHGPTLLPEPHSRQGVRTR